MSSNDQNSGGGWVIFFSLIIAMALTVLPLPHWLEVIRPQWVAMAVIYWVMAIPNRYGVGLAWLTGLFLDVLTGNVLGQQAMGLTVVAYITLQVHQRLRVYPMGQQAFMVMVMVALYQMLLLWVRGIIGHPPETWLYWLPSLFSMLFWPVVFLSLREMRRRFQVG